MRILLLSFEFPTETGFGGIGSYTWYQARALARLGHDVHVLAGASSPTTLRTTEVDGVQVHRYRAEGVTMRAAGLLGRLQWWWSRNRLENAISMARGLQALARRVRFDVVEMPECGADGLFVAGRVDIPTIVRAHSPARLIMPFYPVRRGDVALCARLEQVAIDRATGLSSCSQFLARELCAQLGVREAVQVIPNGIDLATFDAHRTSVEPAPRDATARDTVTVCFAGRLETRKGIHLCEEIITRVLAQHDVRFVFAGDDLFGVMAREMLPRLEQKGLRHAVRHLGKLTLSEVRTVMGEADIVLMPSLWENCPYACLEAMAAGRAIVGARQGGMPELIEDEVSGLLADVGDAAMFAARIVRLVESAELRRRLGAAARASVERSYNDEHIARMSVAFYEACVNRR